LFKANAIPQGFFLTNCLHIVYFLVLQYVNLNRELTPLITNYKLRTTNYELKRAQYF
jgi:hypothetical protein